MGDIADYYEEEYYAQDLGNRMSSKLKTRVGRYSVSDEEIKDLIF